jgi:hypothetical protein
MDIVAFQLPPYHTAFMDASLPFSLLVLLQVRSYELLIKFKHPVWLEENKHKRKNDNDVFYKNQMNSFLK